MSEQTALAGRIRRYLEELEKVVDRAILLSTKAEKSGDDGYWDGVKSEACLPFPYPDSAA